MKNITHTIQGFNLSLSYDGETTYADIEKGQYAGTLSLAENTGGIDSSCGSKTLKVPQSVINAFWKLEQKFSDSLA
jgi:hypothetical protein